MFDIKVIQRIEIPTLDEPTLKELLTEAIIARLPSGAIIEGLDFSTKRNPQRVFLDVRAKFDSEPEPKSENVEHQMSLLDEPLVDSVEHETVADILNT